MKKWSLVIFLSLPLLAQEFRATLVGRVTDPSDAPVASTVDLAGIVQCGIAHVDGIVGHDSHFIATYHMHATCNMHAVTHISDKFKVKMSIKPSPYV